MSKGPITDTRVKLLPSKELLQTLYQQREYMNEIPENLNNCFKLAGFKVNIKIEISNDDMSNKLPRINTDLLLKLCKQNDSITNIPKAIKQSENDENNEKKSAILYLNDLIWINSFLKRLRVEEGSKVFLHQLLENCELILPKNSVIERNPELEERCKRLREEQQNLEYMKMTKNVDSAIKHYPEDTIAFQIKSLNSQMIAVFQFVVSVATGFVFGFIGIPLLRGDMDFGSRIMLGIFCGVIVAIAEIYFLAKKLNEYDDTVGTLNKQLKTAAKKSPSKPHQE